MYIKQLEILNFRNYEKQSVDFSRETNVFFGNNAQGKTNLLEALALFSSGKSYRRSPDRDLIRYGENFAKAAVEFDVTGVKKTAEIKISDKMKFIRLNGVNLHKTSELLGAFKCVIFSPGELMLISGAPEIRRSFSDMVLSSLKPLYYDGLKKYYKILKQKNNLLKGDRKIAEETLSIWNEELSAVGSEIMLYRKKFINDINPKAESAYSEIAGGREKLCVKYMPSVSCETNDLNEIKARLFEAMERKKQTELYQGTASIGIHRDDFEFFIDGKNARSFASQGQQRSAVIALKEAEARLIYEKSGEQPVLLLDDVLSELDSSRRSYILKRKEDRQVIITCTDKMVAENSAKYFYVENGTVTEV